MTTEGAPATVLRPPVVLPRAQHNLSRSSIDEDALKVLYRLSSAGHIAYLVGGGVRDLLLGRSPKDFDISTSAHPREVRRLFRNCRLIGRRFRLAHVVFGPNKIIEVSTFRRKAEEPPPGSDLLVRDDNTFGTPEEDAQRRDITINGLFYDIATFSVIDFVGGLGDLERRTIQTIGDPHVRLREDPVRMLRVVKFAARLGFRISEVDLAAIREHRADILRASPERLRLELARLLGSSNAVAAFQLLHETGLLDILAPELTAQARNAQAEIYRDLSGLDQLVGAGALFVDDTHLATPLGALLRSTMLPPALPPPAPRVAPTNLRGLGFAHSTVPRRRGAANATHGRRGRSPAASGPAPTSTILPLLTRFAVPRREVERLLHVFSLQPRLRESAHSPRALRAMHNRPQYADAVAVHCCHLLGEGVPLVELEELLPRELAARRAPAERGRGRERQRPPVASEHRDDLLPGREATPRGRRRRRRGRANAEAPGGADA